MSEYEEKLAQDALEKRDPQGSPSQSSANEQGMARELLELTGLLAWQIDEVVPRSEIRSQILAKVRALGSAQPAPSTASDSAGASSNVVAMPRRETAAGPARIGSSWMGWAAAAGLLLALGFATWSGFLFARLQSQGETVARLEQEVLGLRQASDIIDGLQPAAYEQMAQRVDLLTSASAEVCALKPAGDAPSQPQARALLWADRSSRHWVLSASQLEKCPLGREYRIWFVAEDGTTSGGAFRVKGPEQRIEIQAEEMPVGTRAIMLTLEFPDQVGDEPGGELVLYGDEARQML